MPEHDLAEFGIKRDGWLSQRIAGIMERIHDARSEFDPIYWYDAPEIPGVEIRPYWWGDDDAPEYSRPNLAFDGVEIRMYKYWDRGATTNVDWNHDRWLDWAQRLERHVEEFLSGEANQTEVQG